MTNGSSDDRIADILERFILAEEPGEEPDLAELCGGDADVERTVRRLLDLDATLGPSLDGGDAETDATQAAALPFEQLGEFRLVAPIGSGASGKV